MSDLKKTYITNAIRRYRSLFSFPEYWIILLLTSIVNVLGSIVAFMFAYSSLEGIYKGVIFGFQVLTIPTIILDVFSAKYITKWNNIFTLKRTAALSLVLCGLWVIILNVGGLLQRTFNFVGLLSYVSFFGVCTSISFRFLVLITVTQLENWQIVLLMFLQPFSCLLSILVFWNFWDSLILLVIFESTAVLVAAVFIFIRTVNKHGELIKGVGVISLFKGFLANWLADSTDPLEQYFEKMGSNTDVSVALLNFVKCESIKTIMVIPGIHPGPFRNLGSSNLPYMIQKLFEKKFNAITMVPHGASGHELDLTSQIQCERVLREVLNMSGSTVTASKATKMVRVESSLGKATCQIFGDIALITVTCAPRSMEDIPKELGSDIKHLGKELGIMDTIIIDAHNSIGGVKEVPVLFEEDLEALRLVALESLELSLKESKVVFGVGVAKVNPKEFGIAQGIGPSGIIALVVVVGDQKVAYVTIDGNNMISGLREDIYMALNDLIDDCEILTTDTHIVNAVSSIERGYHPVGEVVDQEILISYIRKVVSQAVDNVQTSEVAYRLVNIQNVKVIGEEKLLGLTGLIDSTFKFMAWLAPIIFVPAFVISILPLFLLA